jgi:hypothetical protein
MAVNSDNEVVLAGGREILQSRSPGQAGFISSLKEYVY